MSPVQHAGFVDPGEDEAIALICDAVSPFGTGRVRILYGGGTAGNYRVLTIVNGVRVSVAEAEIEAVSHLAAEGNGGAVIDAGGFALVYVDGADAE